jgi:hypothetical protein
LKLIKYRCTFIVIIMEDFEYGFFNTRLEEFCQKSKKEENLKILDEFIKTQHNLPNFKDNIYKFLKENVSTVANDYYSRVIKVLLKNRIFNEDKLYESFCRIDRGCSYTNFYGYAIIQTLSIKSIQEIFDTKNYFNNVPYNCNDDYNEFEQELSIFFQTSHQYDKKCFIIKHYFSHFTPLFVEQHESGHFRIFITDSLGSGRSYCSSYLLMPIQKALLANHIDPNKLTIYSYKFSRQKTQYGCDIFSMDDVIQFAKKSEEIIKWALKSEISDCEHGLNEFVIPCYHFSSLPPNMMQLTHLDNLRKYDQLNEQNIEIELMTKNKIGNDQNVDYNLKMELILRKYVTNLIISKDMIE